MGRLARTGNREALPDALMLLQPDIDPHVFADQTRDIAPLPDRSVVVLVETDPALRLSGRFAGTNQRVGNTPESVPSGFQTINLTNINDASTPHLVALSSPTALRQLREIYRSTLRSR